MGRGAAAERENYGRNVRFKADLRYASRSQHRSGSAVSERIAETRPAVAAGERSVKTTRANLAAYYRLSWSLPQ